MRLEAETPRVLVPLDAEILLVRVVRPYLPPLFRRRVLNSEQMLADAARIVQTEQAAQQAGTELAELAATVTGPRIAQMVLVGNDAAARIVDWMRTHPVTFVVAAAQQPAGMGRMLHAGVAERVVRSGLAPVMTVTCHEPGPARPSLQPRVRSTRRRPCCSGFRRTGRSRWRV